MRIGTVRWKIRNKIKRDDKEGEIRGEGITNEKIGPRKGLNENGRRQTNSKAAEREKPKTDGR